MLETLKKDYVGKATIELSPGHTQAGAGLTFIGSQVLTAWEQGGRLKLLENALTKATTAKTN